MTERAPKRLWLLIIQETVECLLAFSSKLNQLPLAMCSRKHGALWDRQKKHTQSKITSLSGSFHFVSAFIFLVICSQHTLWAKRFPVLPPFVTLVVFRGLSGANFRTSTMLTFTSCCNWTKKPKTMHQGACLFFGSLWLIKGNRTCVVLEKELQSMQREERVERHMHCEKPKNKENGFNIFYLC